MNRSATVERNTQETRCKIELGIDGNGNANISTGIPFFDHMLTLFAVHAFFDLKVTAEGDLDVDFHHTVEDVGIVLGQGLNRCLAGREGIRRYGFALTPMDESLASVALDLSKRHYLVFNVPVTGRGERFDSSLTKEFFRAFSANAGMNLHINLLYGENEHHMLEAIFKACGQALDVATSFDERITGVRSSKGVLG